MSDFALAMCNVSKFKTANDVVNFLRNPNDFQQYYMLWLELSRPVEEKDETFSLFKREVWERKKVGKQTEDTRDEI